MLQSKDRVAEWIQNKTCVYAAYKRLTSDIKTQTEHEMEKGIRGNGNQKKAEVAILISDNIDF